MWQWLQNSIEPLLTIIGTIVISSGASVGIAVWFFKSFGERWLSNHFAKRHAAFTHEQSKELEQLKSSLKLREEELNSLRDAALGQLGTRTAALDKRRLEAAEHVWGAVVDYGAFKSAVKMTSSLNIDEMFKIASLQNSDGEKMRAFASILWKMWALDKTKQMSSPDKERPFLSALAWAKFVVYRRVLTLPVAQVAAIMNGVEAKLMADTKPLREAAKSAFPEWARFIEEHGTAAFPFIVDDLEEEVLQEIVRSIESPTSDSKHLDIVRQIVSAIAKFPESAQEKPIPASPDLSN